MTAPLASIDASEAALAARWHAGPRGPLRLQDGRILKVIFPGIPGAGHGPDVRDALLDAGGDYLRGDVEFHLLASGWAAHGHASDRAYASVVLHVVAHDDLASPVTRHNSGRAIPLLVFPMPQQPGLPSAGFTPPCAFEAARGRDFTPALRALSLRRLRMKGARVRPAVAAGGAGQALYAALLQVLGGPANGEAFASLAGRLPLPALLETAADPPAPATRALAVTAALKGIALDTAFRRAGIRPAAAPERRLAAAGALIAALWPTAAPGWPSLPDESAPLLRRLQAPGIGRSLAIELAVNAVLPAALASAAWPEEAVITAWSALPSPGVYGRLQSLESWLATGGTRPFRSAAALQAGLLLHADYCSRGRCGRCPLSE